MRHRLIGLAALGLAAGLPVTAAAQDEATEIRFLANDTCGGNYFNVDYELTINGVVVARFDPTHNGCTCAASGIEVLATITDQAALDAVDVRGCNDVRLRTINNRVLVQGLEVQIDRARSGTERICLRGNCDFDGGVCTYNNEARYQWLYSGTTFTGGTSDIDGDGTCDGQDADADGDGIAAGDNCPFDANVDQTDTDGNGRGDACDPIDRDGDGIWNINDNCPDIANADQADADGNGTGDLCQPAVATVPWLGDPLQPHQVYSGGSLILQGAAYLPGSGEPVPIASATWDPGDGSGPQPIAVDDPLALELTHTYTGSHGQPFTATLTVTDSAGNVWSDTMRVVIQNRTLDVEVNMAIDKGLWFLHKQQARSQVDGVPVGSWIGRGTGEHFAGTSSAVQAFEVNGHRQSGDPTEDPYVHTVNRGLNYVLSQLRVTSFSGAADTNGNGYGLSSPTHHVYSGGQAIDALVASATPDATAQIGDATRVRGRTYRDIVQDMLDAYAYGQSATYGGWIYSWGHNGIDSSSSQWAAIGDLAAQVWGVQLPQFVRDRNWNSGIPRLQTFTGSNSGSDGMCGYRDRHPHQGGMANTPSCMIMMIMDGQSKNHPRYIAAERWMDRNWNSFYGKGYMYGMFALTKAMRLARDDDGRAAPITLLAGSRDWYQDYADFLVRSGGAYAQQADGRWRKKTGWEHDHLTTAWALIILSPTVFELAPIARCSADPLIDGIAELGGNVTFSGAASSHQDPDVAIVSYHWDFRDGHTASGVTTNHAFQDVGIYEVRLTVTDENGLQNSTTCAVDVRNSDIPPNANAGGPYQFCLGDREMILDGTSSTDLDTHIVRWDWDLTAPVGDGSVDASGATVNVANVFQSVGTFDIALTVTDVDDPAPNSDTEFTTVRIVPADDPSCNQPPTAVALPDGAVYECTGPEGAAVTLNASDSLDPDGDALAYSWDPADDLDDPTAALATGTFAKGGHTLTLTVTDPSGASDSDDASFSVVDTTGPTVSCDDAAAECAGPVGTPVAVNGSADDVCDPAPSLANDAPPLFGVGETTVTWLAADTDGNPGQCISTVTVSDTLAPVVSCEGGTAECAGPGRATHVVTSGSAADQCQGDLTATVDDPGPYALGDTAITYRATDAAGNTGTCGAVVTVVDTLPPTVTCEGGTAECAGPGRATPVATSGSAIDVCQGDIAAAIDDPGPYALGETAITYSAADASGNSASCAAVVTVVDTTPPALDCAADVTVEADAVCIGHADPQASAADVCDAAPMITRDPAGTEWALGTTTVTHTAVDGSGNTSTCQSTVEVIDVTPPTIQCNSHDITPPDAPISFTATAADNCSVTYEITGYDCWMINGAGKRVSKLQSCEVSFEGDTITIHDSGGVNDNIEWTVVATDGSGNTTETTCAIHVDRPGNDGGGNGGGDGGDEGAGCNQGVGNGDEGCDPGNSNQGDPENSNDEAHADGSKGSPGNPGRPKAGKKK